MIHSHIAESDGRVWAPVARASFSPRLRSLYGFVQALPALRGIARSLVARVLPPGSRVWMPARAGLARGLWLNVDPRYEYDYVEGPYEPILQQVLAEQLHEGATFYDVGAHIGFFSLIAARLVGESGAVFAFEADPENARRIKQHISKNAPAQIEVSPVAVWSQSGNIRFQRGSEFSSHNTGSIVTGRDAGATIEVEAVTLDEFAENHRAPTLIKVDVEGGEIHVLRGAVRLFSNTRPALFCEVHNQKASGLVESYLAQWRYSLRWLTGEADSRRHLLAQPS